jgi:hypothetical protein
MMLSTSVHWKTERLPTAWTQPMRGKALGTGLSRKCCDNAFRVNLPQRQAVAPDREGDNR